MNTKVIDKTFGCSQLVIKAIDDEKRIIRGMATTPEPDRVGDVVEPLGCQFKNPLPFLWMHMHSMPIGTVTLGKPTKDGVPFEAHLPLTDGMPSQMAARIEEAWASIKSGLVRFVSIGFRPLEYSVIEETGGYRFTKTDIFELSAVVVPAQPNATISQVKAFDAETRAALGNEGKEEKAASPSSALGKSKAVESPTVKLTKKENEMSLADKIKAFKDDYDAKKKKMLEMAEKSGDAGETFTQEQQLEYDALDKDATTLKGHIERLEKAMSDKLTTAIPVDGVAEKAASQSRAPIGSPALPFATVKAKAPVEKGIEFARYAMCLVAAKNNPMIAMELAKTHYGDDSTVTKILEGQSKGFDVSKAAVAAGTTLNSTWAAPLVDLYQTFAGDFIEYLRPLTIVGQFGTGNIPSLRRVPFNIRIGAQTSGASAQWVGEGKAKPVTKMDFDDVELRWAKIAAIAVLTEELIRFSDPSAERLVRDELAKAVIERMDIDFVNPAKAAVSNVSPASITNGVTPITSSGDDIDAIKCDLQALWAPFIAARNAPRNAVYIMSSTLALALSLLENPLGQPEFGGLTINGGNLKGVPVIVSDYMQDFTDTAGEIVVLANASDIFLSDDGQVTLDASREATIQMDGAPTQDSGAPTASTGVSMFQTNSVAIRAERYINWAKRRSSAVQVLDGVNWGSCAT